MCKIIEMLIINRLESYGAYGGLFGNLSTGFCIIKDYPHL